MIKIKKILIVEDEPSYSKLLHEELGSIGYKIIEANNGKEGLIAANAEFPDIIVLDIKMPVMNGMDMLAEIRKSEYGKSVKAIVLTNLEPNDEIIQKVVRDKPTYYLIKSDIQLNQLIEKIKEILKQ